MGQAAIDHWLLSAGLADGAEVEVGAGADGLWTGTEGEEDDAPIDRDERTTKGHNSLQLRLKISTAATEEDEEELELETREAQIPPMDDDEWEAYRAVEEEEIRAAEASVTGEEFGKAARRLEAIEEACKSLAKRVKQLSDHNDNGVESKQVRMHRKMLRWRRWLRMCDEHPSYPDDHRAFHTDECAGIFGAAPQLDKEFAAVI